MHAHWVHHAFPKHFHDCYTIGINDAGTGFFECRHDINQAWPGRLNLIAPGETHTGQVSGGRHWIYRDFYISVECMSELTVHLDMPGVPAFRSASVHDPDLASRFQHVFDAMSAIPETQLEQDYLLLHVIRRLFLRHAERQSTRTVTLQDDRRGVKRVREFVHAHYCEEMTTSRLAAVAGWSPYHLIRAFRRETGVTPHAYQNILRVSEAQKRLRGGGEIVQVAIECGFYDQSHMTRLFRRLLGATPGQYRPQRAILSKT
jgi:AraC-like DNA-binding protein